MKAPLHEQRLMRILVTGSRAFTSPEVVNAALEQLYRQVVALDPDAADPLLTVVQGDCPSGADLHARQWARTKRREVGLECYPAENFGPWPICGPLRNAHMVRLGADVVLAFWLRGAENKGTAGCVKLALAAGIPVYPHDETGPLLTIPRTAS